MINSNDKMLVQTLHSTSPRTRTDASEQIGLNTRQTGAGTRAVSGLSPENAGASSTVFAEATTTEAAKEKARKLSNMALALRVAADMEIDLPQPQRTRSKRGPATNLGEFERDLPVHASIGTGGLFRKPTMVLRVDQTQISEFSEDFNKKNNSNLSQDDIAAAAVELFKRKSFPKYEAAAQRYADRFAAILSENPDGRSDFAFANARGRRMFLPPGHPTPEDRTTYQELNRLTSRFAAKTLEKTGVPSGPRDVVDMIVKSVEAAGVELRNRPIDTPGGAIQCEQHGAPSTRVVEAVAAHDRAVREVVHSPEWNQRPFTNQNEHFVLTFDSPAAFDQQWWGLPGNIVGNMPDRFTVSLAQVARTLEEAEGRASL